MVSCRMLEQLSTSQQQQIVFLGFGGPEFAPNTLARQVTNYSAKGDPVARLAFRRHRNDDPSNFNVVRLEGGGHRLQGGPYDESIQRALEAVEKKHGVR